MAIITTSNDKITIYTNTHEREGAESGAREKKKTSKMIKSLA